MKTNFPSNFFESCIKDVDDPANFDFLTLKQNESYEFIANEHNILLVVSGHFSCSLQGYVDEDIGSKQMIFISMSTRCCINTSQDTFILCLKPGLILNLFNYPLSKHKHESLNQKSANRLSVLGFTPLMAAYVESVKNFWELGFNDTLHINIKTQEFFHLLSVSYSLNDLTLFFQTLASKDKKFTNFIYKNYRRVESIRELAALSYLSLSGFEKRFRKVFGVSALHWITSRRASDIFQEINSNQKSIKQISSDYGFSSVSHFHKFCKSKLGLSPGHIRRQSQGL